MADLDEIRTQENEQVYQHLLEIRKIVACKLKRDGADKAVAELFKWQHKLFLSHGCLSWAPTAGLATNQIVAFFG